MLNLESPLMSFGGEVIDSLGVIRWFPTQSMLTGLIANALGLRRIQYEQHQRLQDRLVFAARIDREPAGATRMRDFQTVQLHANDRAWTTRGQPEGRSGSPATYEFPHLRYRDYFADMLVTVALRLEPNDEQPSLDGLACALREPSRPLFIGRKPCLPSTFVAEGFIESDTVLDALISTPIASLEEAPGAVRMIWPGSEGRANVPEIRSYVLTDLRNWASGLHGGGRVVCEGSMPVEAFPQAETCHT